MFQYNPFTKTPPIQHDSTAYTSHYNQCKYYNTHKRQIWDFSDSRRMLNVKNKRFNGFAKIKVFQSKKNISKCQRFLSKQTVKLGLQSVSQTHKLSGWCLVMMHSFSITHSDSQNIYWPAWVKNKFEWICLCLILECLLLEGGIRPSGLIDYDWHRLLPLQRVIYLV